MHEKLKQLAALAAKLEREIIKAQDDAVKAELEYAPMILGEIFEQAAALRKRLDRLT